MIGNYFG